MAGNGGTPHRPYGDGEPPPALEFEDICAGYLLQTAPAAYTVTQSCGVLSAIAEFSDDVNGNGTAAMTHTHTVFPAVGGTVSLK